jgi:hypothetical protein
MLKLEKLAEIRVCQVGQGMIRNWGFILRKIEKTLGFLSRLED